MPDVIDGESHLTPADLATRWHLTTGHLANLRTKGQGPAYLKIGAAVRYRLADVLRFEAARTFGPAGGTA